jgi:hypothetical protein
MAAGTAVRPRSTRWRARRHRLTIAAEAIGRDADRVCFVVGTGRTGTHLLVDYLASLPGVAMRREILNGNSGVGLPSGASRQAALRHVRRSIVTLDGELQGAKLLLTQLEDRGIGLADIRSLFHDARFLVQYRSDLAAAYVSRRVAAVTRDFQGVRPTDDSVTVHVDEGELLDYCVWMRGVYARALAPAWMRECALPVEYEELAGDAQRVFDERIVPFLEITGGAVASARRKQMTRPLSEVVANYADVAAVMASPACVLSIDWQT